MDFVCSVDPVHRSDDLDERRGVITSVFARPCYVIARRFRHKSLKREEMRIDRRTNTAVT